jgi:putative endonuclease
MWYVYFLRLGNGHVYVGSTGNLRRRIQAHNSGDVPSTRAHVPAPLESYMAVTTRERAVQLERYFKSGSGKAFAKKRFL